MNNLDEDRIRRRSLIQEASADQHAAAEVDSFGEKDLNGSTRRDRDRGGDGGSSSSKADDGVYLPALGMPSDDEGDGEGEEEGVKVVMGQREEDEGRTKSEDEGI